MKFIMVHAFWVRLRNDRSRPVSCPNCLQAGCRDCSALRGRVDVAGAAHGLDDLRLGRIALDLAADAGDADVDAAVEGLPVAIVREVPELVAGQPAVGGVRRGLQPVELPSGQADFTTAT